MAKGQRGDQRDQRPKIRDQRSQSDKPTELASAGGQPQGIGPFGGGKPTGDQRVDGGLQQSFGKAHQEAGTDGEADTLGEGEGTDGSREESNQMARTDPQTQKHKGKGT